MRDKHSIGNRTEETQTLNILDKDFTLTSQRSKLYLKNLKYENNVSSYKYYQREIMKKNQIEISGEKYRNK